MASVSNINVITVWQTWQEAYVELTFSVNQHKLPLIIRANKPKWWLGQVFLSIN